MHFLSTQLLEQSSAVDDRLPILDEQLHQLTKATTAAMRDERDSAFAMRVDG
jgi:hypothetical protein